MRNIVFFFLMLVSVNSLAQNHFPEVVALAKRQVPWISSSLIIKKCNPIKEQDRFELQTINGKLCITATNANAAAMGLGWYLKYYCSRSISHLGDNIAAPVSLPIIIEKIVITSPYKFRYALNYCTVSYSMANYNWDEWQRELDWMALSGVNLMLAPVGMEIVWQNTLLQMGYTRDETLQFIAHPAFSAWWLMGNLEGWGGPISQPLIEQQKELQQKILNRMQLLGIHPVMQGFYGIVPTTLKNKINIDIVPQGIWAGDFVRPDFLNPADPAFSKIAQIYYHEIKKNYGKNLKYFGGDPFHEGGSGGKVNITQAASIIQNEMNKAFAGSTWVLQGWQSNPSTELLNGLDKSNTLVIELFGENTNNWEKRKGYENTPFIWCNVSNFGENTGLYAKLQRFADEVYRASNSQYSENLKGVGIMAEGIYNNPVSFDLMLELGWHSEKVDVHKWIKQYQLYRYGMSDTTMEKAWDIFLKTVYRSPDVYQEGEPESIFCARPSASIKSVSTWGTRKYNYDIALFKKGVELFVSLDEKYKNSDTYQTDKADLLRQVLANEGDTIYKQLVVAWNQGNMDEFRLKSTKFLNMISLQDSLLSKNRFFRLDYWLKKAENFTLNTPDKLQAIRNTKMQYTIWGPDTNTDTNLHEYAFKEWSGLLGTLYYKRWELFFDSEIRKLKGESSSDINYFKLELEWVNNQDKVSIPEVSDVAYKRIVQQILND